MTTVEEIKRAIERLPLADRERIEAWFLEPMYRASHVAEPAVAYAVSPDTEIDVDTDVPSDVHAATRSRHMSVDEYLKFDEASELRHEYVAGEVFALSGATVRHNAIGLNLASAFRRHLRGGPCKAFMEGCKVHLTVDDGEIFYYPDVMVVCGRVDFDRSFLDQPKLIVEVLSPSTARIDRREKALAYRQIAALEEYVLVAQKRPEVTFYRRSESWNPQVCSAPEAAVAEFRSIALALTFEQIYEGVYEAEGVRHGSESRQ